MAHGSILNREAIKLARERLKKLSFVDANAAAGMDPMAMGAAGLGVGGAPPGGAPPGGGGAPPGMGMDAGAGMMGGMSPDGAGAGAGGGGGISGDEVRQIVSEMMAQQAGGAPGAAGPGGAGAQKKKIDVNTELYQIKRLLVKLFEMLGQDVEPSMLLGDPADEPPAPPPGDPAASSAAGQAYQSAIQPIEPMQAANPQLAMAGGGGGGGGGGQQKQSLDWSSLSERAGALRGLLQARKAA